MKLSKEFNEDKKNTAIVEIKVAMKANKDLLMHERYQTILYVNRLVAAYGWQWTADTYPKSSLTSLLQILSIGSPKPSVILSSNAEL